MLSTIIVYGLTTILIVGTLSLAGLMTSAK